MLITLAAATVVACAVDDPVGSTIVYNDLDYPVILQVCDASSCNNLNDRIDPGKQTTENVSLDSPTDDFRVTDVHGRVLGCLVVVTKPKPPSRIVVSKMVRSRMDCE